VKAVGQTKSFEDRNQTLNLNNPVMEGMICGTVVTSRKKRFHIWNGGNDMRDSGREILVFEALAEVGENTAYGVTSGFNGLFKINMATGECTYIMMFPKENRLGKRLYTKALHFNNRIYFIPCSAKEIAIYDIGKNEIRKQELKAVDKIKNPWFTARNKFNDGVIYKNWIFMIGASYPAIVRIDLNTGETEYFDRWVDGEFSFKKSPVVIEDKFYIPSVRNNKVLCFSMSECKGQIYHVGENNRGSWGICKAGDELWLSPRNPGAVIRWKPATDEIAEFNLYPEGFKDNGFGFTKIYASGKYIFLISAYANMNIKVDRMTGEMSDSHIFPKRDGDVSSFLFEDADRIFLKNRTKNRKEYFFINYSDHTITPFSFKFSGNREGYFRDYFAGGKPVKETAQMGIKDLLERLTIC